MSSSPNFFLVSAQAVLQIVLLSAVGAALEATGELGPSRRSALSAVAFRVLLPSLLFTSVGAAASLPALRALWVLPAAQAAYVAASYGLGAIVAALPGLLKVGDAFGPAHVKISCALSNAGYLPLVILPAALSQGALVPPGAPAGAAAEQVRAAIGYVGLCVLVLNVLTWLVAAGVLRRADAAAAESTKIQPAPHFAVRVEAAARSMGLPASAAAFAAATITWIYANVTPPVAGALAGLFVGIVPPLRWLFFGSRQVGIGASAATAPAAAAAVINATTIFCNGTLYSDMVVLPGDEAAVSLSGVNEAPLGPTFTSAMLSFAAAVGPIVAITLGSNIAAKPVLSPSPPPVLVASNLNAPVPTLVVVENPLEVTSKAADAPAAVASNVSSASAALSTGSSKLAVEGGGGEADADLHVIGATVATSVVRTPVLIAICVVRLVLSPIIGIALVWAGCRAGVIASDPVLLLVLLVESAMPSAMNLQLLTDIISAGRGGAASRAMARVLATQYLTSVLTITAFLSLFLTLIQSGFFTPSSSA